MNWSTPGSRSSIGTGMRVRINNPLGIYHGKTGTVLGNGRSIGSVIVEIDGSGATPEIKRGHLVPVPPGSEAGA
jgi:ribosomal protein L21E